MSLTTRWRFPALLLLIGSLLLNACGGNGTPSMGAGVAPTNTTGAMPVTPGRSDGESHAAFKFDPAAYKKNAIEPGAQLRVSSWGDASEQKVVRDALVRFNQVYPDVK